MLYRNEFPPVATWAEEGLLYGDSGLYIMVLGALR